MKQAITAVTNTFRDRPRGWWAWTVALAVAEVVHIAAAVRELVAHLSGDTGLLRLLSMVAIAIFLPAMALIVRAIDRRSCFPIAAGSISAGGALRAPTTDLSTTCGKDNHRDDTL